MDQNSWNFPVVPRATEVPAYVSIHLDVTPTKHSAAHRDLVAGSLRTTTE